MLMDRLKAGKVTIISPGPMSLEFCFRMEIDTSGAGSKWQLVDGKLLPIKDIHPDQPAAFILDKKSLAAVRDAIGSDVVDALRPLIASKDTRTARSIFCHRREIEAELRAAGLTDRKYLLFDLLTSKKTSGCFVVTACMGNENHGNVVILRRFRDEVFFRSRAGECFIKFYEEVGPWLAYLIRRSSVLRRLTTIFVVEPAAYLARRRLARYQETPPTPARVGRRQNS
jgi:hypothetical protein